MAEEPALPDYGSAGSQLGDDSEETSLGGVRGSAVGGVVAEPDGVGYRGIEVGQVKGGYVSGGAVDEQPGAGLPDPVRSRIGWQPVVDVQGAADGEGAIGDVVGFAHGPLLLAVVDEERTDLQSGGLIGFGIGSRIGLRKGNSMERPQCDGVDFGSGSEDGR